MRLIVNLPFVNLTENDIKFVLACGISIYRSDKMHKLNEYLLQANIANCRLSFSNIGNLCDILKENHIQIKQGITSIGTDINYKQLSPYQFEQIT